MCNLCTLSGWRGTSEGQYWAGPWKRAYLRHESPKMKDHWFTGMEPIFYLFRNGVELSLYIYWNKVMSMVLSLLSMATCKVTAQLIHTPDLLSLKHTHTYIYMYIYTGELGYDRLNGTTKIGPSYAKSVVYIWRILDMHRTGTKHIVRHMQTSVVQWSVISKFTCIYIYIYINIYIHTCT